MSPTPKDKARPTPKAGTAAAKSSGRLRKPQKVGLIAFGAILVVLFAGFAIGPGITNPSVGSDDMAVVEDAVPGTGTITVADLDRSIAQSAARAGLPKVPKPSDHQYAQLRDSAINELLDTVWIQGQAAEMGITVTPSEIAKQLETIKKSQFRSEAEYEQFLKQSKFTKEDVNLRVKLQILSQDIQQQVADNAPAVTDQQISDYYDAAKSQFAIPASRDVRLVLNTDKAKVLQAKAALENGSTDADWKTIAAKYSTDPSSQATGGLRPGLTEGLVEEPLNTNIFSADTGAIVGPVRTPLGYYVFQVGKVTDASTQPLDKVRKQISDQLKQQNQQAYFSSFVEDYGQKWQSRTFCGADYIVERCENFKAPAHPDTVQGIPVDKACYEADPKKKPDACPAPVALLNPALPGTVTVLSPTGTALPQRPIPEGLKPVPTTPGATGLPGATGGTVPPGTTGAPPGSTPGG